MTPLRRSGPSPSGGPGSRGGGHLLAAGRPERNAAVDPVQYRAPGGDLGWNVRRLFPSPCVLRTRPVVVTCLRWDVGQSLSNRGRIDRQWRRKARHQIRERLAQRVRAPMIQIADNRATASNQRNAEHPADDVGLLAARASNSVRWTSSPSRSIAASIDPCGVGASYASEVGRTERTAGLVVREMTGWPPSEP